MSETSPASQQSINGLFHQGALPDLPLAEWTFGECLRAQVNDKVYEVRSPSGEKFYAQEVKLLDVMDSLPEQSASSSLGRSQVAEPILQHPRFIPSVGVLRQHPQAKEGYLVQGPVDPRCTLQFLMNEKAAVRGLSLEQTLGLLQEFIQALREIEGLLYQRNDSDGSGFAAKGLSTSPFELRLHPSSIIVEPSGHVRFLSYLVLPLYLSHEGFFHPRLTVFDAPECGPLMQTHLRSRSLEQRQVQRQGQGHDLENINIPSHLKPEQHAYSLGVIAIYLLLGSEVFTRDLEANIHNLFETQVTQRIRKDLNRHSEDFADVILEVLTDSAEKRPSIMSLTEMIHRVRLVSTIPIERLITLSKDQFFTFFNEIHMTHLANALRQEDINPSFFTQMKMEELAGEPFNLSAKDIAKIRPLLLLGDKYADYVEKSWHLKEHKSMKENIPHTSKSTLCQPQTQPVKPNTPVSSVYEIGYFVEVIKQLSSLFEDSPELKFDLLSTLKQTYPDCPLLPLSLHLLVVVNPRLLPRLHALEAPQPKQSQLSLLREILSNPNGTQLFQVILSHLETQKDVSFCMRFVLSQGYLWISKSPRQSKQLLKELIEGFERNSDGTVLSFADHTAYLLALTLTGIDALYQPNESGVRKPILGYNLLQKAMNHRSANPLPDTQLHLGICLIDGRGVRSNPLDGLRLIEAAASTGHPEAKDVLARLTSTSLLSRFPQHQS